MSVLWQLSCLWRQMFDSWWQQPQIAFCKDPIHHPGTRAASTDCSTRILGALRTIKDLNLWSVLGSPIGCHGIVHGLKCVFCQITPETTGQPKSSFVDDGTSLHGSFMTVTWSLLHVTQFFAGCCELIKKGARKFGSGKSFCAHKLRICCNIYDRWVVFPQFCSGLF